MKLPHVRESAALQIELSKAMDMIRFEILFNPFYVEKTLVEHSDGTHGRKTSLRTWLTASSPTALTETSSTSCLKPQQTNPSRSDGGEHFRGGINVRSGTGTRILRPLLCRESKKLKRRDGSQLGRLKSQQNRLRTHKDILNTTRQIRRTVGASGQERRVLLRFREPTSQGKNMTLDADQLPDTLQKRY